MLSRRLRLSQSDIRAWLCSLEQVFYHCRQALATAGTLPRPHTPRVLPRVSENDQTSPPAQIQNPP